MLIPRFRFSTSLQYFPNSHSFASSSLSLSHMSNHKLIPPTAEGIAYGASLIKDGGLVAFPTETVYGLGANALDAQACTSIFRAKGRPMTDPLIVHVAEPSLAAPLVSIEGPIRQMFEQLAAEFWPGPLTIIVKAAACIPPEVTANTGFVGIRCPNHPLALTFLAACQLPVAAPSANLFGHVSPTLAQHVLDDLGERGVCVLDGDSMHERDTCLHGIESTVVKLDNDNSHATDEISKKNQITILRQGAVSQAQLERVAKTGCAEGAEGGGRRDGCSWSVLALQRQVLMEPTHPTTSNGPATTGASTDADTSTGSEKEDTTAPTPTSTPTQDAHTPTQGHGLVQSGGEVAPGQSLTHYAPYIPCYAVAACVSNTNSVSGFNTVTDSSPSHSSHQITLALEKYAQTTMPLTLDALRSAVILDFLGQLAHYSTHCLAYRDLSVSGDATAAARGLFAALRWAELQPHATRVLMAPIISSSAPPGKEEEDGTTSTSTSTSTSNDRSKNDKELLESTVFNEDTFMNKSNIKIDKQYDLFFGLSDRIFRATSGASVQVVLSD